MKNFGPSPATAQLAARDAFPLSQASLKDLIDELIDCYVSWREACFTVATSYENWSGARHEDRDLAYSAYSAALDREERAADAYQSLAARLSAL